MSQHSFDRLRDQHPVFTYEKFSVSENPNNVEIEFEFRLGDEIVFRPTQRFDKKNWKVKPDWNAPDFQNLVFHIGLVELISYWKCACSPTVVVKPYALSDEQIGWWKNLWFHGLGEFFYLNQINVMKADFMNVVVENAANVLPTFSLKPKAAIHLVPVGGGKDSAVTLGILAAEQEPTRPFIINPRGASIETVKATDGLTENDIFTVERTIDPKLLELNQQGYLNGHTPFSALVAFDALLAAALSDCRNIILSNEGSASEPTVHGSDVNHQYSKSYQFEADFRDYVSRHFADAFNYFSLLRPVNETQIVKIFSDFNEYFPVFKSCNVGSKTDSWCGRCSKCLFTYVMLAQFVGYEAVIDIFGKDLLTDESLIPTLDELCGLTPAKPFECVGTVAEFVDAMHEMEFVYEEEELDPPVLVKHFLKNFPERAEKRDFDADVNYIESFHYPHFVPKDFAQYLKEWLVAL